MRERNTKQRDRQKEAKRIKVENDKNKTTISEDTKII
jgi:hypothetical protein